MAPCGTDANIYCATIPAVADVEFGLDWFIVASDQFGTRTQFATQELYPAIPENDFYALISTELQNGTMQIENRSCVLIDPEESYTITVTPNIGYKLQLGSVYMQYNTLIGSSHKITLAPNADGTYTLFGATRNTTIYATFDMITYNITTNAANGAILFNTNQLHYGESCTFTVTANEGYEFEEGSLTATNGTITKNADGSYTLSNVTENATVSANFIGKRYDVSVASGITNGSIVLNSNTIQHGGRLDFTVTPNEGYILEPGSLKSSNGNVYGTGQADAHYLINVTQSAVITANFVRITDLFDAGDIAVINALITENDLQNVTVDAPNLWLSPEGFAAWNNDTPKRIFMIIAGNKGLSGHASVTGLSGLTYLSVSSNHLYGIDLSGLTSLATFQGAYQTVSLTLNGNAETGYTLALPLNNPTFDNAAVSYAGGVLTSTDNSVTSVEFTVETGLASYQLSGTITFDYAEKAPAYFVTFSGEEISIEQQEIEHGSVATRPENPTREGYNFAGWFTEPACENEWDFDTQTVTAHTTLYAKWVLQTETGVKTVLALAAKPVAYYNLLGQKLNAAPEKGIFLVKYADGRVEKVFK
ncbi:MAG: InlB B-repeat-containing protein [Bacteroidales bacterium]|nr:InlB B-repeat-containing protein [Bacteroidales bacterium]